jgi:hypothetical protein
MDRTVERHIEMEARERNFLRYEAIFWGVAFTALALGAAILAFQAVAAGSVLATVGALTLGVGALFTYVKRDETREEYLLKSGSGRDKIAAKHWAEELGVNRRLVGEKANQQEQTQSNVAPAEIAPSDEIIPQEFVNNQIKDAEGKTYQERIAIDTRGTPPTPTNGIVEKSTTRKQTQQQERADGKKWGDVTKASQEESASQTLSK